MEENIDWEQDLSLYEFNQDYFESIKEKLLEEGFLRCRIGSENYTCGNCEYDSDTDHFTYCDKCKNRYDYYDIEIINKSVFYRNLEKTLRRLSYLLTMDKYTDYKFIHEFMYVISFGIARDSPNLYDESHILENYIEGLAKINKKSRKIFECETD